MTQPIEENERHSDEFDRASELEQAFTADAIRSARRNVKRSQEPDANGNYAITECVECGEDIGIGRLRVAAKNHICIDCATFAERGRR